MRNSRRITVTASFFLALFVTSAAYAYCDPQQRRDCQRTYVQCSFATGGDPDLICETAYNQCLMNAGCPIP